MRRETAVIGIGLTPREIAVIGDGQEAPRKTAIVSIQQEVCAASGK